MPVRPDPESAVDSLLLADDGATLARLRLEDDGREPAVKDVRPLPGAAPAKVAAQLRRDLAGRMLKTTHEGLVAALLADGLTLHRAATGLRHDLAELPPPAALPDGWSLVHAGWDDDLAVACASAYGPEHPDGEWQAADTREIRAMFDDAEPVPPLLSASARVVGPDGRSAGHVLCAGPVPWTTNTCGWILNIAVAPHAQGSGLGRALLTHALRGTHAAGLPTLDLSVVDQNPARRLYDKAGFRPVTRMFSVALP
ncbi:GNAT family N-acetyltransferase [Plantactinospora sp. ZYX-F-223]|uniref:GNAT family N-acetyltransferase n=1 Tax=Plantactinospora sp. ZYX-F-223 TaxID=3144103 RepID=UPI0031FBFFD8